LFTLGFQFSSLLVANLRFRGRGLGGVGVATGERDQQNGKEAGGGDDSQGEHVYRISRADARVIGGMKGGAEETAGMGPG
jgi:hypothetical protein